jgi:hypothetical protein
MRGGRRHRAGGLLACLASVTLGLTAALSLSIAGCADDYLVAEPGNAKGTQMNMAGKGQPVAASASPMAQSTPTTSVVGGHDAATTPATCAPSFECPEVAATCVIPLTSRECTCALVDGDVQQRHLWICQ